MRSGANTMEEYILSLPVDRQAAVRLMHQCIVQNLPEGFEEAFGYGMPGYVVPYSVYPAGYHCKPKQPLPFIGFASQKQSINFYHMGLYADPALMKWFVAEFPKHCSDRLDMGKSCVRFRKVNNIPYGLIGALVSKVSVSQWIETYERVLKR